VDAIENRPHKGESRAEFEARTGVDNRPILALLAGSRVQEIKGSLPIMLESAIQYNDYQIVIAGVKSIDSSLYQQITKNYEAKVIYNETYELLQQADLAVVTSGTATLETALMRVPEVVVYKMSGGWLFHRFLQLFIRVPYISLVNLIANKWLVQELVIEEFTVDRLSKEIDKLRDAECRKEMLKGYDELIELLGKESVSDRAAHAMLSQYNQSKNSSI
jgi:lipid-A-disaccharide synthase